MGYSEELIITMLAAHGIKAELTETMVADFMDKDIYSILNPKAVSQKAINEISDELGRTSIVSYKNNMITIETSYDVAPHPFSAYSKAIKESKAEIPIFFGESMNEYEIADIKTDGNILICGKHAKARKNILNTALSSIRFSHLSPEIIKPDTAEQFIRDVKETTKKHSETIIVIEDLPKLLSSENGMEIEKLLYIKRNAKNLHFIAATRFASGEIITDIIKKSFPVRITANVSSSLNSKLILGTHGAEMLTNDYDYLLLKDNIVTHVYGAKT